MTAHMMFLCCVCADRVVQRGHLKVHVPGASPRRSGSLEPTRPSCSGWVRDFFGAFRISLQFCCRVRFLHLQALWSLPKRAGGAPKHRQRVSSIHGRSPVALRSPGGVSRHAPSQTQPCWAGKQSHSVLGHEEVRVKTMSNSCLSDFGFVPKNVKNQLRLNTYFAPLDKNVMRFY